MTTEEPSIQFNKRCDSPIALAGFGALQLQRRTPNFNWGPTFAPLPVNTLFVRDIAQMWYLRGLAGISSDVAVCARTLRGLLNDANIDHFAMLGAPLGGWAALLYGALMGADEVHAFSPVTYLPSRTG